MKAIYLTGFMGAGKSTVGKKLAQILNLPVIDTDEWIEQHIGKKVSGIFAEEGEQAFRSYERKCLQALPIENIVITTGGGIVIQENNRKWMRDHGIVVYLHCEEEVIYNRLIRDKSRPLLEKNKKENIKKLMEQRLNDYYDADIIMDVSKKHVEEIVHDIISMVKK